MKLSDEELKFYLTELYYNSHKYTKAHFMALLKRYFEEE